MTFCIPFGPNDNIFPDLKLTRIIQEEIKLKHEKKIKIKVLPVEKNWFSRCQHYDTFLKLALEIDWPVCIKGRLKNHTKMTLFS